MLVASTRRSLGVRFRVAHFSYTPHVRLSELIRATRRLWKRLLSYRKSAGTWTINDYPLIYRYHASTELPPEFRLIPKPPHRCLIDGWPVMDGSGTSPAAALEALRIRLEQWRDDGKPVYRPGTQVPIKYAPDVRIVSHGALANDFIHRVLDVEWAFLSDDSSLYVSDVPKLNIADILNRIASTDQTR